jgi:hypothetical protein
MSGNSTGKVHGSYGDQGVSSPSNFPGPKNSAIGWRDNDGNLWIFGGNGYGDLSSYGTTKHSELLP